MWSVVFLRDSTEVWSFNTHTLFFENFFFFLLSTCLGHNSDGLAYGTLICLLSIANV